MIKKPINLLLRKEVSGMTIEALSVGKDRKHPELNEDGFVVTPHTFAVIDGSAPRIAIKFSGKSSAHFAKDILKKVFVTTAPILSGHQLVTSITTTLNEEVAKIGAQDTIAKTPEARPAALFTVARIYDSKLVITAVGDVHCRVNGQLVHKERILTEDIMIEKRIAAMNNAFAKNQTLSDDELRRIGRDEIEEDLKIQVRKYFNNSTDPLGLGIVDGRDVPEKFVQTYEFDLSDIHTLEIFSDGYYVIPKKPTVEAFEQEFFEAEKKDPLRWREYPAVKSSTPDQYSDDRTVLIAQRK